MACGPYHMALVTANGALYTMGDGFGGKLGHGSFLTECSPRQVCPSWHAGSARVPAAHAHNSMLAG